MHSSSARWHFLVRCGESMASTACQGHGNPTTTKLVPLSSVRQGDDGMSYSANLTTLWKGIDHCIASIGSKSCGLCIA